MENTKCKDCGKTLKRRGEDFCDETCKLEHDLTMLKFGLDPSSGRPISADSKVMLIKRMVDTYGKEIMVRL